MCVLCAEKLEACIDLKLITCQERAELSTTQLAQMVQSYGLATEQEDLGSTEEKVLPLL